ncbi:MAG: sarcosine oxidase subunit delta [Pseudomonadales bacterium]|nr:sarcosine oxidase subunit delta [Pseudomonadales bacterium]MCP5183910.1 sarcosine oxidase subunit delta [Pseudomonadales bacterium]
MLRIHCPYCCEDRAEEEFVYAGEAGITRPLAPEQLDDAAWGDYLFFRTNPRGAHQEMWFHASGCRRYFKVLRDTVTYALAASCRMDESLPLPAVDVLP